MGHFKRYTIVFHVRFDTCVKSGSFVCFMPKTQRVQVFCSDSPSWSLAEELFQLLQDHLTCIVVAENSLKLIFSIRSNNIETGMHQKQAFVIISRHRDPYRSIKLYCVSKYKFTSGSYPELVLKAVKTIVMTSSQCRLTIQTYMYKWSS